MNVANMARLQDTDRCGKVHVGARHSETTGVIQYWYAG